MASKTRTISFRIRKIDTDLTEAIATISKEELSQHCRDGLRLMFGLTTSRVSQVVEKPISVLNQKAPQAEQRATMKLGNQGAPPIYKPKS